MSENNSNPYAAPEAQESETEGQTALWRYLMLVVCMLVGGLSSVVGLLAIGLMIYLLLTGNAFATPGEMLAGCTLYLGFGVSWMMAGYCFWRQKDLWGVLALVIGVSIPVTLFSIFGF